ncbi:hypothetical protein [Methylobacterium indicum]|uniref:Uncharacterized protein n=1 Tax=Methylobacterium indicum TaxID=1775910 RepID=A0A8H9C5N1_9HYPH|nr:hypothetical protein [Methylobacterium indicum]BCM84512.1 hypothetical protein mvi_29730 [Methylobacterium indicum]
MAAAPFRLRAVLAGLALAGILATPAAAEDFTGFYAGINAGYGWSRERDAGVAPPGAPLPAWDRPREAEGLPPSAARAADRNPFLSGSKGGTR